MALLFLSRHYVDLTLKYVAAHASACLQSRGLAV